MKDNMEKFREEEDFIEYKAKERKCLSCQAMFDSEWSGNRICHSCKSKPDYYDVSHIFDNTIEFPYDLTVAQILDELRSNGALNNNFVED